MKKPTTMVIKDTKTKLANVCNESGLHIAILDLIVKDIYYEIHTLAEKQSLEEELAYVKELEAESIEVKEDAVL